MSPSATDVRIRKATRGDIPAIVAVHASSVPASAVAGFGTPQETQIFADAGRLAGAWTDPNRVRSEEVLVCEIGGGVVAYATIEDRGSALELVDIDVAGDHQRRGIGRLLVTFIEEHARAEGRRAVTLGTSRNAAGTPWSSFPWWRSLGYHVTHEEENAWTQAIGPGTREIRMRKDLRPPGRLELRPVRQDDLPVFFEQQLDPLANHVAAFTAKDPSDRNAFEAHWSRVLADPTVTLRTVLLDGRIAGHVGSYFDQDLAQPEVFYWIGREFWGRGIASRALVEYLRERTTRPIYARVATDNVGSIRVLEKAGFVRSGRGRGFANARRQDTDEFILRLDAGGG